MNGYTENKFVKELLGYSAESDKSISGPNNWEKPPPLFIETPLTKELERFADSLIDGAATPTWYFLVGGPGNGKSEAVRAFIKRLDQKTGKRNIDPDSAEGDGQVKYLHPIKLPNGSSLSVIQDISVPKVAGEPPENDLIDELLSAIEEGKHILCCANRGMLLRAIRLANENKKQETNGIDNKSTSLASLLNKIDTFSSEDATGKEYRV